MGRSTGSCWKIITCANGDSVDEQALSSPKSKISSDKRGWSFRKRSSGQQVPINPVISEPVSTNYSKERSEISLSKSRSVKASSVPNEALIQETSNESRPSFSDLVHSEPSVPVVHSEPSVPVVADTDSTVSDHNLEESAVVMIQAVIRGCLAQNELHKLMNVVKLQAAIRGHLVRRQAVDTLRCAQAIVKMQAIIRARLARNFSKKLDKHEDEDFQMDIHTPALMGKKVPSTNPDKRYISTKRLASNKFICQLLKSAPSTKPIYISCDPSKSDSAWKWLERWMGLNLSERQQHENISSRGSGLLDQKLVSEGGKDKTFIDHSVSSGPPVCTEDETHVITENSGAFEFQKSSHLEIEAIDIKQGRDGKVEAYSSSELPIDKAESDSKYRDHDKESLESPKAEGKRYTVGSNPSNPVNSMFGRSIDSSPLDAAADSRLGSTDVNSMTKTKDIALIENSFTHDPRVQIAVSDCGTEISISSTLDSPDRSDAEAGEIVLEIGSLNKQSLDVNGAAENPSFNLDALQPVGVEESDNLANYIDTSFEQSAEQTASDIQSKGDLVNPEDTPRSHTTTREFYGTPSSQTSVNAKKSKKHSKIGKKSPSKSNKDSGGRNVIEKLEKDSANSKRKKSLGKTRSDHVVDQEPRISTSNSNSLPSYMQATESARAKAYASSSPKSSPDVQNRDNHMKKRHSLPIANGKQGSSPRIQRSTSQAHQNAKGNDVHSPHNSAERRWQR